MTYHVEFDIDFKRNSGPGKYIALEGIDGSGKTTQVERLGQYFKKQGKSVVLTKEPRDDGVVGSLIRQVLQGKLKIPSVALQYLFSADRAIHHEEIILPAIKRGEFVISDRCFWSVVPYGIMDQVMQKGGTYDYTQANVLLAAQGLLSHYHRFTVPDQTFYLSISLEAAMARITKERATLEIYEEKEKLEKIISGYEWLLKEFPDELKVMNGEQSVEKVTEEIITKINF